jgi:hypothetical protein
MTQPASIGEPPGAPPPRLEGSFELAHAALTLEAMRLGVVPSAEVATYTVGRDAELAMVDGDLRETLETGGTVRAILGDYGTGKTHLLELIRSRALAAGFLVAEATLDPVETPPSHPKRVYRSLVRSLAYPDQLHHDLGLRPLLEKGCRSEAAAERFRLQRAGRAEIRNQLDEGAHLYLTPALRYLKAAQAGGGRQGRRARRRGADDDPTVTAELAVELLLDWIEGHPTISNQVIDVVLARTLGRQDKVYSLLDFRPWARIYAYLLNGIARLARCVGYGGLVVLLDEAEFYALLSSENRDFARTLFKALAFAAVGGTANGQGDDAGSLSLPFEVEDLSGGGYGVQQRLPTVYDAEAGLYVVFAMTPNPDGLDALTAAVPQERCVELTPLRREQYIELSRRVCDFYVSARPDLDLPEAVVAPLGKVLSGLIGAGLVENPRRAMKFIIEFLDVVRYHRDQVSSVVRGLQERLAF